MTREKTFSTNFIDEINKIKTIIHTIFCNAGLLKRKNDFFLGNVALNFKSSVIVQLKKLCLAGGPYIDRGIYRQGWIWLTSHMPIDPMLSSILWVLSLDLFLLLEED